MAEEKSNNYISLQEATEYCFHTQEYLSLRARQGKLKAVKIGRNWITKKKWVKEYIERVEEYNNNLGAKKLVPPPENLPIEEIARVSPVQLRPALAIVLVFVLLIAGGVLGKTSFQNVFEDIEPYTYIIGQTGDIISESTAKLLSETISDIPHSFANVSGTIDNTFSTIAQKVLKPGQELAAISSPDVFKSTLNTFKEYGQWLNENIKSIYLAGNDFVEEKISQGFKTISQFFKKSEKIVEEKLIPKPVEVGMVVIPSTEKDEETKKKIKEAFSDEVRVEPVDKTSGIIIPVFRDREGEKYLYILVPTQNEN